jgi:hypothetical protein
MASSGFVESPEQQKDPRKDHTFFVAKSNGNASKRVLGNSLSGGQFGAKE